MVIKLSGLNSFLEHITTKKTKTFARNAIDKTANAVKHVIEYYYVVSNVPKVDYKGCRTNRSGLVKTGKLLKSVEVEYGDFRDMRITANKKFEGKKAYIYSNAEHYKYLINLTHRYTRERGAYDFMKKVDITKFKKY
jgi:hypothetical protein